MASDQVGTRPVDHTAAKIALEVVGSYITRMSQQFVQDSVDQRAENSRLRGEVRGLQTQVVNLERDRDDLRGDVRSAHAQKAAEAASYEGTIRRLREKFETDLYLARDEHKRAIAPLEQMIENLIKANLDLVNTRSNPPIFLKEKGGWGEPANFKRSCSHWGFW